MLRSLNVLVCTADLSRHDFGKAGVGPQFATALFQKNNCQARMDDLLRQFPFQELRGDVRCYRNERTALRLGEGTCLFYKLGDVR
jgi:hypothetical protein